MAVTVYKEGAFGIISGTPYACLEELRSQGIYNSSKVVCIANSNQGASTKDILLMYWTGGRVVLADLYNWFKFNEASGSTAIDMGSLQQSASLISGAVFRQGMDSLISGVGALYLSGIDAKIAFNVSGCAVMAGLSGNKDQTGTISVWVNPSTNSLAVNKEQVIYELVPNHMNGTSPAQHSYMRVFINDTNHTSFDFRNYSDTYNTNYMNLSGATINTNVWNHIAVTSDGTRSILYLNGEQTATKLSGANVGQWVGDLSISGTYSKNIGAHIVSGTIGNHFTGYIDNLRIANRAFNDEEIRQLYDAGV